MDQEEKEDSEMCHEIHTNGLYIQLPYFELRRFVGIKEFWVDADGTLKSHSKREAYRIVDGSYHPIQADRPHRINVRLYVQPIFPIETWECAVGCGMPFGIYISPLAQRHTNGHTNEWIWTVAFSDVRFSPKECPPLQSSYLWVSFLEEDILCASTDGTVSVRQFRLLTEDEQPFFQNELRRAMRIRDATPNY